MELARWQMLDFDPGTGRGDGSLLLFLIFILASNFKTTYFRSLPLTRAKLHSNSIWKFFKVLKQNQYLYECWWFSQFLVVLWSVRFYSPSVLPFCGRIQKWNFCFHFLARKILPCSIPSLGSLFRLFVNHPLREQIRATGEKAWHSVYSVLPPFKISCLLPLSLTTYKDTEKWKTMTGTTSMRSLGMSIEHVPTWCMYM